MPPISRNLENQGEIFINKWWSGVDNNRSPLFTPVSAMGIQLIARQDTLIDGLNFEVSPKMTMRRRYGFLRYCPTQFSGTEFPLTFYSFKNLAGSIFPMVDTPARVWTFTSSGMTTVYAKATTNQTMFAKVANMLYGCDGQHSWKWDGTTLTFWGIVAPTVAPSLAFIPNGLLNPQSGYQYGYVFRNPVTGHVSTMSPASANTGPLVNQTVIENQVAVAVTNIAITTNVLTVTANNNFQVGQSVLLTNIGTATFLNNQTVTVIATGLSATKFEAAFTHTNYVSHLDTGTATMTLSVPNATPWQYTVVNASTFLSDGGVVFTATSAPLTLVPSSPTTGQYSVAAGVYTFAAADANKGIAPTYTYSLATSTGVNIQLAGSGSSDAQATFIDIYRTDDGGALYFFLASIANTVNWTYVDSTPDSGLNDDIVAPVAGANNPPPTGSSLTVWHMGRLWVAAANVLYFSGGPDTVNGVGAEAFPSANNFPVPGNITALASTSAGLLVWTSDNMYIVYGQDASSFTVPQLQQQNYGVANQNNVTQDGDLIFLFTNKAQLFQLQIGTAVEEIGFSIAAFLGAMNPANLYLSVHRSGQDEGLFVSDGSTNLWRYSIAMSCWSPVFQPVGGCSAIGSIEVSTGNWRLLMGRDVVSGYILDRDPNTFSDDGTSFTAFFTVGSLVVSPAGKTATVNNILTQVMPVGTYPTVSVLINEVSGTFTALPNPTGDPSEYSGTTLESKTVLMKRHALKSAQKPLATHVEHLQVKISIPAEATANELLALGVA